METTSLPTTVEYSVRVSNGVNRIVRTHPSEMAHVGPARELCAWIAGMYGEGPALAAMRDFRVQTLAYVPGRVSRELLAALRDLRVDTAFFPPPVYPGEFQAWKAMGLVDRGEFWTLRLEPLPAHTPERAEVE